VLPKKISDLFDKEFDSDSFKLEKTGNAPVAGPRFQAELPKGQERFQLYSVATPNGQKIGIMLEELAELGLAKYDAHIIHIGKGDQFGSGFTEISPNQKIPALVDTKTGVSIAESGAILLYLAEQTGKFLPTDMKERINTIHWLVWQNASMGPFVGQYNHFLNYAPKKYKEAIAYGGARYGMETQRLLSVLEAQLKKNEFIAGSSYTIADISTFGWARALLNRHGEILQFEKYPHVRAWIEKIEKRDAVQRGLTVCSFNGVAKPWLEK